MKDLKTPITRNNLFYSKEDFDLETEILMDYLEEDTNQTVVLYEVDRVKTNMDENYLESNGNIMYKTPKEIPCLYSIEESELKSFDNKMSNGVYSISGKLTIYIMPMILKKYNCDIKRGDYIGVLVDSNRMFYFTVTDDGKVNTSNSLVVGAYKTAWRVVKASPCPLEEFDGK